MPAAAEGAGDTSAAHVTTTTTNARTTTTNARTTTTNITTTAAIEATGLTKSYKSSGGSGTNPPLPVLRGIDLHVPPGTVFALLGPNGAGKTTAVRILATLTEPDAGTARVAGYDIRARRRDVRRAISLTGQFAAVDEAQTGAENLRMMARLAGLRRAAARARADELLARFGLSDAGGRLVRTYSGGMRRRVDLAAGLVGEPRVIFLDEPTTGLDPRSRRELWDVVGGLAARGTTVFLTTQYLEEADHLADRVAVLHGGAIVAEGTTAELKSRVVGHHLDLTLATSDAYLRVHAQAPHATRRDPRARTLALPTDGTARHVRALLDELDPTGTDVAHFALRTASLDEVFLTLTAPTPPAAPPKEPTRA
ncbi:ABC transporter ATP-binding protein [Streptomyces flavofungini]|uniref:ABC transporter ATP-binding protein n=1 Tax=Streptomyces flavofungini TaxID=68200 RepID=UPI0025B11765|nr:ATP-binding cassette domain-containing protein [Streptomyces flavofungini]WJV47850.1 ATP-binding cassette domain-containing protein [Streptomyces flavofungini]